MNNAKLDALVAISKLLLHKQYPTDPDTYELIWLNGKYEIRKMSTKNPKAVQVYQFQPVIPNSGFKYPDWNRITNRIGLLIEQGVIHD